MKHEKCFPHCSFGFTLIELLVVIAALGIISTTGVASYVSYSRTQAISTSAQEVATALNTTKSRALSQVKPSTSTCGSDEATLHGYKLVICGFSDSNPSCSVNPPISPSTPNYYQIIAMCGATLPGDEVIVSSGKLANNVLFGPNSARAFFFPVLSSSVQITNVSSPPVQQNRLYISGFGLSSKTIDVSPADGKIVIN